MNHKSLEDIDYELEGLEIAMTILNERYRALKGRRKYLLDIVYYQNSEPYRRNQKKVSDRDVTYVKVKHKK